MRDYSIKISVINISMRFSWTVHVVPVIEELGMYIFQKDFTISFISPKHQVISKMTAQSETISFDPCKVRFDLTLREAFQLTQVTSLQEYQLLLSRLPELRGHSYFFINILDQRARLVMTIITAEDQEITATFVLDHDALGIRHEELMQTGQEDGNYSLLPAMEQKIRRAMRQSQWQFFKLS